MPSLTLNVLLRTLLYFAISGTFLMALAGNQYRTDYEKKQEI